MASDEEEELEKMIEAMKIEIVKHSLTAVDDFDNIVKYSLDQNLNPKWTEHAAELLADWIKSCSIFQRTRLIEKTQKISDISKVLLSRQFSYQFSSGFSVESLLSKHEDPKITARTTFDRLFNKKPLPYPMAYGINTNGKLGVGVNTDKTEEGFQPIQLEGDIEKAYIGENHTIIVMRDGEYYGVGQTKNFLHEPKENKPFSSVPIVLDYINAKRNKIADFTRKERCELTADTTVFRHFQKYNHHLIVGKAEYSDNNWEIINERPTQRPILVLRPDFVRKITLPDFNDPNNTMEVSISKNFVYDYKLDEYHKIRMFICGKQVVSLDDPDVKYGEYGLVWLNHEETLYRGQLQWAPKVPTNKDVPEYRLVAIMEEVVLEYSVENFAISKDGESVIIYNNAKYEDDEEKVSCLSNADSNLREYDPNVDHNFERDYAEFKKKVKNEWKHDLYTYTGLPSMLGEGALPPIQTLRRFIKMDEEKKVPIKLHETFLTLGGLYKANEVSSALDGHLCDLICESAAIKPIVVEAGWSEEERDERNKQMYAFE
ncbi:hypothetical protein CAEBREN_12527 [Caenorhabditis brenneri]|uniref:Uncharacterized protein n=1 Tax=Caenorhabditis brenneri TaxID=135651 RepID=G0NEW4_CAEBE|nr:hypothetical protein CAEBREN_12527 [Caenorhabditis brenneri]